eukprot:3431909-Pleurochrysis_carterae.AAC.2
MLTFINAGCICELKFPRPLQEASSEANSAAAESAEPATWLDNLREWYEDKAFEMKRWWRRSRRIIALSGPRPYSENHGRCLTPQWWWE